MEAVGVSNVARSLLVHNGLDYFLCLLPLLHLLGNCGCITITRAAVMLHIDNEL